jgi:hypothetical protein
MKKVTFSKNTLHWRLACVYGTAKLKNYDRETDEWIEEGFYDGDICSYIRACLIGLGSACLVTLGIGAVAWTLLDILLWCVASLRVGYWCQVGMGGFMMLTVLGTLAIVGAVTGVIIEAKRLFKMLSNKSQDFKESEPSFVSEVYRKFKTKTCWKITVR